MTYPEIQDEFLKLNDDLNNSNIDVSRPLLDECLLLIYNYLGDVDLPMSKALKNEYDTFHYMNRLKIEFARKAAIAKLTEEECKLLNIKTK